MHRIHHGLIGVGAGNRQHFGKAVLDASCIGAEAARDDHSPLLREGFTDGFQGFLDGGIDKAAGVDNDEVSISVAAHKIVSFASKLGKDTFGVDQRFRTAETHHANAAAADGYRAPCSHGSALLKRDPGRGLLRTRRLNSKRFLLPSGPWSRARLSTLATEKEASSPPLA